MSHENTQTRSPENLTRRQKLLRRVAAPLAAIAALSALHHGVSGDKNPEPEAAFGKASATNTVTVSTQLGGAESGWGHDAATSLIEEALDEGVHSTEFDLNQDGKSDISEKEIEKIISKEPTYNQANQLLDEAGYDEALPDEGDILQATITVTTDTDKNVSYKIDDAEIKDLPNNQNKEQ